MSGFFSSEAERALMGEEEEARRLCYFDPLNLLPPPGHPAYQRQHNLPVVPSQSPWSSFHPDNINDTSSQFSRASSPGNPSDLQNFGYPLSDGTSWKCAYSGCSSQAIFTRGCD
ncbi:MAG: hypothetical protein Q9173_001070 [Seirophora scorigena]